VLLIEPIDTRSYSILSAPFDFGIPFFQPLSILFYRSFPLGRCGNVPKPDASLAKVFREELVVPVVPVV